MGVKAYLMGIYPPRFPRSEPCQGSKHITRGETNQTFGFGLVKTCRFSRAGKANAATKLLVRPKFLVAPIGDKTKNAK
jgi:hypothetical protein